MTNKYAHAIKAIRQDRGFSQSFMAEKLNMSRPSYISIEQGKHELTISEFEKLAEVLGVSFEELGSGESPNYEKYKQMILAFLRLEKKLPKIKLAKLLYLADAAWYYHNLHSMSGLQYRKVQTGPVADAYFRIVDELYDNGQIDIDQTNDGVVLIAQTRAGAKKTLSEISDEELKLIKNITKKWASKKTKELVEFTHNQLPYLSAGENDIISLSLITQENPSDYY